MPQPSVTEISFETGYLKFYSDLPGDNELKQERPVVCDLTVKPTNIVI